jgi:hypothetical protein
LALVKRVPASSALGNENREDAQQQSKIVGMWARCFPVLALGREHRRLSVTDGCLRQGDDGASLLFRVPEPLVNIAHFQKLNQLGHACQLNVSAVDRWLWRYQAALEALDEYKRTALISRVDPNFAFHSSLPIDSARRGVCLPRIGMRYQRRPQPPLHLLPHPLPPRKSRTTKRSNIASMIALPIALITPVKLICCCCL